MVIPGNLSESSRGSAMTGSLEDSLCSAAARGDTARVKELLQAGAHVNGLNRFGRSPIQVMMMGSTSVGRELLKAGANPNVADPSTGATPLHDAAQCGFPGTVILLVEYGANPRARNIDKQQPVDVASKQGHTDVVSILLTL